MRRQFVLRCWLSGTLLFAIGGCGGSDGASSGHAGAAGAGGSLGGSGGSAGTGGVSGIGGTGGVGGTGGTGGGAGQAGSSWKTIDCGTIAILDRVSGTATNDVWVGGCGVGNSVLAHWDGTSCQPAGNVNTCVSGLLARKSGSVWVLGYDDASSVTLGSVVEWPGSSVVKQFDVPLTYTIAASAENDVWVGTESQNAVAPLVHFDGNSWSLVDTGATRAVTDIWPLGPNDAWVVWGESGTPSGGFAHHLSAGSWEASSVGELRAVWASTTGEVWAVGTAGLIAKYDGNTWSSVQTPTGQTLDRIWGSAPNDVWAGGGEVVIHWDGTAWSLPSDPGAPPCMSDIWGSIATDVWVVCRGKTTTGVLFHLGPA